MFGNSRKEKIYEIKIDGISIEVSRKKIKNLYVRVHRVSGNVRISSPLNISDSNLKRFIYSKLEWIKDQRDKAAKRISEPLLEFKTGELILFLGEKYTLELREWRSKNTIIIENESLIMKVKKSPTKEQKERILESWYREYIKSEIPKIIDKYEGKMGVKVKEFGVKKMKTRWGTCNITKQRIWLSLSLAKKPYGCLEMVVVHEMVHLLERLHSKRFYRLMDKFMPSWREFNKRLDSTVD